MSGDTSTVKAQVEYREGQRPNMVIGFTKWRQRTLLTDDPKADGGVPYQRES